MANLIFTHGGNIYEIEKKYKKPLIDFSANINPLGISSPAQKYIAKNFFRILHYPDNNAENVRRAIARYWHINKENILIGNGSVELIYLLIYAIFPRRTAITVPSFSEYERAARCIKSKIHFVPLRETDNFKLNISKIPKSDVLFTANPNNPTGNLLIKNHNFIEQIPAKFTIIDEAFMDFLPDEKKYTLIGNAQNNKKIIVLRTFTKFFALPGLRIGYLVAHQDIITKLKEKQIPWSVNSLAQLSAEFILSDKKYIKETRQFIGKEKAFLFTEIAKIKKLKIYPSAANFLLIKLNGAKLTSSALRTKLIQKGILIRDCVNFRELSDKFIRVAVRSHNENLKLLKALGETV